MERNHLLKERKEKKEKNYERYVKGKKENKKAIMNDGDDKKKPTPTVS